MFHTTEDPGWSTVLNEPWIISQDWMPSTEDLNAMDKRDFMTWAAPCMICGVMVKQSRGIFCGNFLRKRGRFPPCMAVWCGKCLVKHPCDSFYVQKTLDEEEDLETEEVLSDRFQVGRPGDHLMGIPFECDLCHFRNLNGRDPCKRSAKDAYTLVLIWRAMLDACWSRERSTVAGNLSRLVLDYTTGMSCLSIERCPLPTLGNDEVADRVGMGPALLMLNASQRVGRYADHLQHDSTRRSVSWFNNAHGAGELAATEVVLSNQTSSFHIIKGPHASRWKERLLQGMKRRTGVFRKQDKPLTMPQLLAILELAEKTGRRRGRPGKRRLLRRQCAS